MKKILTGIALASSLAFTTMAQAGSMWPGDWGNNGWNNRSGWGGAPWSNRSGWGNGWGNRWDNGPRFRSGPSWGGKRWDWNDGWDWGDSFDFPDFNFGNKKKGSRFGWGSRSGPRFGNGYYRPVPPPYYGAPPRAPYGAPPQGRMMGPQGQIPMMRAPQAGGPQQRGPGGRMQQGGPRMMRPQGAPPSGQAPSGNGN